MMQTRDSLRVRSYSRYRKQAAFSLIDMTIASAVAIILIVVAVPSYQRYQQDVQMQQAVAQLQDIDNAIKEYFVIHHRWPTGLTEVGMGALTDPWGNSYQYRAVNDGTQNGLARKVTKDVPINQDYDLYSKGPDGQSADMLHAPASSDDIIRAQSGNFFGMRSQLSGSEGLALNTGVRI